MSALQTIHGRLSHAVVNGASVVQIKSDKPAFLRLSRRVGPVELVPITPDAVRGFIEQSVPAGSYNAPDISHFSVNGFFQPGSPSMVMRHMSDHPATFSDMNIDRGTLH
jgi:twitching motility protein PilT